MIKETKKAPTIRFRGFTDDWEQHKLDNLCLIIDTKHATAPIINEKTSYRMIRTDCVRNGRLLVENMDSVTKEIYDKWSERIHLKAGDIVFTREAPMGESAIIPDDGNSYFPGQRIVTIRSKGNVSTLFINYLIYANEFRREIRIRDSAATTVANFGIPSIKNYVAQLPCVKEQRKIGKYFHQLDNLITLHQRKLDQLKKLKKYFLQNMFPTKGEKVPRIRFKGFTGDWEQRKLGEMAESFQYGLNAAAKKYDGKNKYIRITDIDDLSHEFLQSNLTSPDTDISQADNYRLNEGNILFARTGASVGKTYIYKHSDGRVYYAGFLIRAKLFKEYAPEFIFQNTLTSKYKRFIQITSQRSGQPGVNAQEYADYGLMVPSLKEQKGIGKLLANLDHLITLHQRKLNQLLTMKKFMLQNLFI